jgi:hypothetical protein
MENVTFCESGPSRRQEEINLTALIRGLSFTERALEKDPEWIFLGRNQSGRMAGWCQRMKNEKKEIVDEFCHTIPVFRMILGPQTWPMPASFIKSVRKVLQPLT